MICPYDRRTVDPTIVAAAGHTHAGMVEADRASGSDAYGDPHAFALRCDPGSPPPAPPDAPRRW